jgi:hypothetical protein
MHTPNGFSPTPKRGRRSLTPHGTHQMDAAQHQARQSHLRAYADQPARRQGPSLLFRLVQVLSSLRFF